MCFANKVTRALSFSIIVSLLALAAGCNTTPVTRSSGAPSAPGSPAPSGSPGSSGPSVQVQAPGMPGVPGLPSDGTGDAAGAPAPVTVSIPAPQPGMPSADTGGASSGAPAGARQQPGGATSAGAGDREKTEDEILAEALEALKRRPAPGQQGEDAAGQMPRGGAGSPAVTDAEKKQALGEELEQGFAEFDRVMLSEQQANNERADQEGGGGFPEDDDLFAESEPAQGAAGEPLQTAMVDTGPASIKGEMDIPTRSQSRVPPDLVDASDDDIIARQLREAAMKEQDPELREKLWDEYRKYKRDLR